MRWGGKIIPVSAQIEHKTTKKKSLAISLKDVKIWILCFLSKLSKWAWWFSQISSTRRESRRLSGSITNPTHLNVKSSSHVVLMLSKVKIRTCPWSVVCWPKTSIIYRLFQWKSENLKSPLVKFWVFEIVNSGKRCSSDLSRSLVYSTACSLWLSFDTYLDRVDDDG